MNLRELKGQLEYWQARLNLREWSITLQWLTPKEAREFHGLCAWSVEDLTATIKLWQRSPKLEATLVHELLHLVLQGHREYETYDPTLERAINRISAALMEGR